MPSTKPLFEGTLRYCVRCCMPESAEGQELDELGICRACRSSEEKMHIDWEAREAELQRILDTAKAGAGSNYDCIIPISGGKDSIFQLHVLCKVYGMKPLAVTFSHNWFSKTGWYNLMNSLETFNVDHIMFTPNRDLVNRMSVRSLKEFGDTCWHCHMGCGSFPLQVAVRFRIPLLVYGEPSAENYSKGSYLKPILYDREYFLKISARKTPAEMADETLPYRDIAPLDLPSAEECEAVGVHGIHLGTYLFWDDERQTEFVRDTYGWRETEIEQAYKHYKSAECVMPGMHDFTCYLKRGFTRATVQASTDVRNGLITREEGLAIANAVDPVRPEALDYFLKCNNMTEAEFHAIMERHRVPQLRGVDMPVLPKDHRNAERILPFAQQIIEEFRQVREPFPDSGEPGRGGVGDPSCWDGFFGCSVGRVIEGYRKGEFGPAEVAEACIRRHASREPMTRAWAEFDADALREQARLSGLRLAAGETPRLLEGIPVGVKDIFNTVGFGAEMGSPIWKGHRPGNDARAVSNLRRAGAVVPGKTETAEFAVHTLGRTLNPYDPSRTPGTSSSGSAAAVATGMVPVALGTQTAGSITRPASFCGVYGCKPSFGLIPRTGVLKTTDSLDTVGFFSLWYEDLRRMFDVLRVRGDNYPMSHKAMAEPDRRDKPEGRPWRVALVRTHVWDGAPDYARSALEAFAGRLDGLDGVEVVEVEPPASTRRSHEIHAAIYDKALSYYFREEYRNDRLVSPVMNELIRHGLSITPEQYHQALRDQEQVCRDMDAFMQGHDVLLSLGTAGEAPLREVVETPDPSLMWTLSHLPVIAAPTFRAPSGMPFGLQFAGRRYADFKLFAFADHLVRAGLLPERSREAMPVWESARREAD